MKTAKIFSWMPGVVLAAAVGFNGLALGASNFPEDATGAPNRSRSPAQGLPRLPPPDDAAAGQLGDKTNCLPSTTRLSPWAADMVKLAQAGVEEGVMLSFLDSAGTFNLDSDQIIYLRDVGIPDPIISAMMQHDSDVAAEVRPVTSTALPSAEGAFHLPFTTGPSGSGGSQAQPATAPAGPTAVPSGLPEDASQAYLRQVIDDLRAAQLEQTADEPEPGMEVALNHQAGEAPQLYPVREPYPVPLSDPIIMIRAEVRPPNIVIIAPLQ